MAFTVEHSCLLLKLTAYLLGKVTSDDGNRLNFTFSHSGSLVPLAVLCHSSSLLLAEVHIPDITECETDRRVKV